MPAGGNPDADDYYEVLGVPRGATESDIKKAYKKAALRHHPDKNPDDRAGAEARFKNVSEAYEALADPQKRAAYDQFGKAAFEAGGGGGGASYGGGGVDPQFFSRHGGGGFGFSAGGHGGSFRFRNAHDLFAEFFGSSDPFSVFDDDPFFSDPGSMRNRAGGVRGMGGFMDPFGGMGGQSSGFSMSFGGPGGFQSSSFSSSSSSSTSRGGLSKSVKTSTVVRDGKKIIKTTTTTRDAQGNVSTRTEEREEDAGAMGGGGFISFGTAQAPRRAGCAMRRAPTPPCSA